MPYMELDEAGMRRLGRDALYGIWGEYPGSEMQQSYEAGDDAVKRIYELLEAHIICRTVVGHSPFDDIGAAG